MFKPMVGFHARLKTRLLPDDLILPLPAADVARVAAALAAAGDYTRLWVGDAHQYEIVRVTGIIDGAVAIRRSDEGTVARGAPLGTCVSFVWSTQNLVDFIEQGLGGAQPAVCEVIAGSDRVTVAHNGCSATVDVPACGGATWRAGNAEFTQSENGCISSVPLKSQLPDGEYVNATVTVRDGYVTAVSSGTNIVYTGGGCCDGGSNSGVTVGPQGPQGPQGQPGPQGPQGPQGPVGPEGPMGPQGSQGGGGADGSTILSGTGAPAAYAGKNGDFYIDTPALAIYGPKTNAGWGVAVSLVGPVGPQGPVGATGTQGEQGSTGADGKSGNWSLAQDGNTLYICGPVGLQFSVETANGTGVVPTTTIPASGRAVAQHTQSGSTVPQPLFIKSDGLYVGCATVLV
ncbi:hypothetical protein WI84_16265 [Burkholderia ubonensis]|uniref:hypothetical protein n=1 Tax=Burkholderia ubonensis TaxID=101571 RepID=UPI00075447E7|nr:hypothetical protein [Burkholderia ubonensis]KVD35423.1 hypothetical protein WI84_16265 [Burkholderia ubonensis]